MEGKQKFIEEQKKEITQDADFSIHRAPAKHMDNFISLQSIPGRG
jgi:hypothetical protein